MSDEIGITSSDSPWRVTMTRVGDGYVVRLHVGDTTVILPSLEAHKLGSALHAASGINTEDLSYEFIGWRDRTNQVLCSCPIDQHDELTHQRVYVSAFDNPQSLKPQGPPVRRHPAPRPDDDGKP
jgi:hypothetical protein